MSEKATITADAASQKPLGLFMHRRQPLLLVSSSICERTRPLVLAEKVQTLLLGLKCQK